MPEAAPPAVSAQAESSEPSARQLYEAGRYEEAAARADLPEGMPDDTLYAALALARLERNEDAREVLEAARQRWPEDVRFERELAGLAFRRGDYPAARRHLRRVLARAPEDDYARELLGTVHVLERNVAAALRYWEPLGRPDIRRVQALPEPALDPVLLDRALAVRPATRLTHAELLATESRLELLEIFSAWRFDLRARPERDFDLLLHLRERPTWRHGRLPGFVTLLRGLPYQTVHPEFLNVDARATNVVSLLRWDPAKRRAAGALSFVPGGNPALRFDVSADMRDEDWELRRLPRETQAAPRLGLRSAAGGAQLRGVAGRWKWRLGGELSHRSFDELFAGLFPELAPELLAAGAALRALAGAEYALVRVPEHRVAVDAGVLWDIGSMLAADSEPFTRIQPSLTLRWTLAPPPREDWRFHVRVRGGKTFGPLPFDQLFLLGLERDTDLALRAHRATRRGRKGNAPMGHDYALVNWEVEKILHRRRFVTFAAAPFLDSGRAWDHTGQLGSGMWLWDTGVQLRARVFDRLGFQLTWGRDLRTGRNILYASASR